MPIKFQCAACAAPIKAPDTHAGQTLPCPKCGQPVQVPAIVAAPPATPAPAAPPILPMGIAIEDEGELPEIVVQDAPPGVTDIPDFGDAHTHYPTAHSENSGGASGDLQTVRIVDIKMPFRSVLRFALQFFMANLLFSAVVGLAVLLLTLLFGAIAGTAGS